LKLVLACALVATLASSRVVAQSPSKEELLERAAAYLGRFVAGLSNVVAEEEYQQSFDASGPRRRLKSDFLLVKYPGKETEFLAFRDVVEVNGRPVTDQQNRLLKLFIEPFDSPLGRAEEIANEGGRHSLARGRLANPLLVISLLQAHYQPSFRFSVRGIETRLGADVREVEMFEDVNRPPAGRQPVRAVAWIEESTGRVIKTEQREGRAPNMALTTTTFGRDAALGIDVPIAMHDSFYAPDLFTGQATYSRFRRFQVHVKETIDTPSAGPR
jgi:hypothetical protein